MSDPSRDQQMMMLGEIKSLAQSLKDGQDAMNSRLDAMDGRLRQVEQRAAVSGAVSGGVMSIGIALIVEAMRNVMRIKGG